MMAGFNHRFHYLRGAHVKNGRAVDDADLRCAHCKGPYLERPHAVIYKAYDYATTQSARQPVAERPVCEEHARKFAKAQGLEGQLDAMLDRINGRGYRE